MTDKFIKIFGAYQNNLKDLNISIPLNKITTVRGVSGSGKSTLVNKIIYEESCRAKRFSKGSISEADKYLRSKYLSLKNPLPTILVPQPSPQQTQSSSVATLTGVGERIKRNLVNNGEIVCIKCSEIVPSLATHEMISNMYLTHDSKSKIRYELFSNEVISSNKLDNFIDRCNVKEFIVDGFSRTLNIAKIKKLDSNNKYKVYALINSNNVNDLLYLEPKKFSIWKLGEITFDFSKQTYCTSCLEVHYCKSMSLFTKSMLADYNGACKLCDGKGSSSKLNLQTLLNHKPISEVFLNLPHNGSAYKYCYIQDSQIHKIVKKKNNSISNMFFELSSELQKELIEYIAEKLEKHKNQDAISKHFSKTSCSECLGTGYNEESRSVYFKNNNIIDFLNNTIEYSSKIFKDKNIERASELFLYLSIADIKLNRSTVTLSGGELQRLKLIKYLGDELEEHLIIIDEPSKGLSPPDIILLFKFLKQLSRKNTILLVDHSEEVVKCSDYSLMLGPSGGDMGGFIIEQSSEEVKLVNNKVEYQQEFVNLSNINYKTVVDQSIKFPYSAITSIFGVSGSGKSNLIKGLYPLFSKGNNFFDEVVYINQVEVSGNRRSTIASYLGILNQIREIFADTELAKLFSINKEHFSANTKSGQCIQCKGLGYIDGFLCPSCAGKRLNPFSRMITYKGKTLPDYLDATIKDLLKFEPVIFKSLRLLDKLGLGHLSLSRETPSLSGGEMQRLKLAKFLLENKNAIESNKIRTLIILDEPMRGLSGLDIERVFTFLSNLSSLNNTILLVEHKPEVIQASDYCIKMGPGRGEQGGVVTEQGEPSSMDFVSYFRSSSIINSHPVIIKNIENPDTCLSSEDEYFEKLRFFSNNFTIENSVSKLVLGGKKELVKLLADFKTYYFNPFVGEFIKSPLISKTSLSVIFSKLSTLNNNICYLNGERYLVKDVEKIITNDNIWTFRVEVNNFEMAYELGFGWISIRKNELFIDFSTRYIDIENGVVGDEISSMKEDQFNFYFNRCSYCNGSGKLPQLMNYTFNFNNSVFDEVFYPKNMQSSITKVIFRLKETILKFSSEGLLDLSSDFKVVGECSQKLFLYGIDGHYFVKKNGRKNALEDRLYWPGIYNFLWKNKMKFNKEAQLFIKESVSEINCFKCESMKYKADFRSFKVLDKYIWDYVV